MHPPLGHRPGASPAIAHEEPFTLGSHGGPHPITRTLQALARLVGAERTGFEVPQHRRQRIELPLLHGHGAEEIARKGPQWLGGCHAPREHRVRINLKDAGGGATAQPFGHAGQPADKQCHCHLLAMKDRAVMFWKIPVAADAVELPPRAATGMAMRP